MSTTLTFVERALTGAVTSGAEVTLRVVDRTLGAASGANLDAIRSAFASEDVRLENLEHGSWAWVYVLPGALMVIAAAFFSSFLAAGAGAVFLVLLASVLRTPEVTATLVVRCRSLGALDRCLEVASRATGVTVAKVLPTSDEARRDGEIFLRARKRAEEMSSHAGLRVAELVSWEEVGSPAPLPMAGPVMARKSMSQGLDGLVLAPDPAAVRFVFRAEPA